MANPLFALSDPPYLSFSRVLLISYSAKSHVFLYIQYLNTALAILMCTRMYVRSYILAYV